MSFKLSCAAVITLLAAAVLPRVIRTTAAQERPNPSNSTLSLVCFGYVDVEGGLLEIPAETDGKITSLMVQDGDKVDQGEALVKLDDTSAKAAVLQAEASVRAAQAEVSRIQIEERLHEVRIKQQQAITAAAEESVSGAQLQVQVVQQQIVAERATKLDLAVAESQVKHLRAMLQVQQLKLDELRAIDRTPDHELAVANVDQVKAKLIEAQAALDRCIIRAPSDGRILRLRCSAGEIMRTAQPLLLFVRDAPLIVRAFVEQEFIGRLRDVEKVKLENEFVPDLQYSGTIIRRAEHLTKSRPFPGELPTLEETRGQEVVIQFDHPSASILLGQGMRVIVGDWSGKNPGKL
ncbi:MAG: HlyD family efflux transporter periplasmic adaptor subunit [Planctomycetales bacterium]|nr:HlyD family efflux transporter periplasmic adaptor subunit [Planctomycetales bacterium]